MNEQLYEIAKALADTHEETKEEKQAFIQGFIEGAQYAINSNRP